MIAFAFAEEVSTERGLVEGQAGNAKRHTPASDAGSKLMRRAPNFVYDRVLGAVVFRSLCCV